MAFFSLLWKARTIEKYRLDYENEKIKSILSSDTELPTNNFMQKCRHFHYDTKKQMKKKFRQWCPEGSAVSNFLIYVRMDQTFPNFLLKSLIGFVGGIILTYLCFMFFVFQLSISLIHATIMSSVIGILLTLGLAFSYRIRCLVFLLIPQFFSRVGRYTLTCYALVLILTGPATNTLKNSEVLSESMACGQEQIKASVRQMNDSYKNPLHLVKDSITTMVEKIKEISARFREMLLRLNRLILSLVSIFQSMYSWLLSLVPFCNEQFGSPYEKCVNAVTKGYNDFTTTKLGSKFKYDANNLIDVVCWTVKPYETICIPQDYINREIAAVVRRKLKTFSDHIKTMLYVDIHVHHTYSFNNNVSKTASQAAAGIVTEIRNRADPMLTWLSWSSCVTSLFLLLIIFRAKYYQHMYETRSRFDNRYLTKELRELDFKRQKQGKSTILPLNRRERMKYICTTSFQLVPSEKVYLSRSAVFMTITTFKLLIHVVADYSLYWILMTIRYHGRFQTPMTPGYAESGVRITGSGPVARFMQAIFEAMHIPLNTPSPMPVACLPDPIPPDMHRYTQIGVLIFLLWFFALFEPYGLRLRHVIMGMYNPERAKARAAWLYNHILSTRAGFMKYARRKLHRQYKYSSEKRLTFKCWLNSYLPFRWLQALFGTGPDKQRCLLCSTKEIPRDPDTELVYCESKGCPGVFCVSCFGDIGQLCTICLSPADYGDVSDISLELGSSDDSEDDSAFDEDDDSSDENKCLLGNLQINRKLSSSKNSYKPVQSYEMRDLSLQKKDNTDKEYKETHFNKTEVYGFLLDINCNLPATRKVDYNNNVLEYFSSQKETKRINNNLYEYLNISVGLQTSHFFSYESMSLVFISTQERNNSKHDSSPRYLKFGCCHEIKIKKRNTNNNKRSRESIEIQCSSIANLFQNTKKLLKNIQPSYYCIKKHKKGLIVRKIMNKTHTKKPNRMSTCIKIVKKQDSVVEKYFKKFRVLKVVSKSKRIKNRRLLETHEEFKTNSVDMSLVPDTFTMKISNSEPVMQTCEKGIEDETIISNWLNEGSDEPNLVICKGMIKKEKSVTWEPIDVIDVVDIKDESYHNEVTSIRKSSQATQIPSDYQYLEEEYFNNNLPSNSKSTRSRDRERKFKTCTCATQHRVAIKSNVGPKEKREFSDERRIVKHHKQRERSYCERHPEREQYASHNTKKYKTDDLPEKGKRNRTKNMAQKERSGKKEAATPVEKEFRRKIKTNNNL